MELEVRRDGLPEGSPVIALLEAHTAELRTISPPESTHALDLAALRAPGVTVWAAWAGEEVVGCAALKTLDAEHAELKSMRTAPGHTRRGVARRLLQHVLDHARTHGFTRLSLETGAEEFFAPARTLYAAHGFTVCAPFGDYRPDPLSVFMTRTL